jgi:small subunit ribosomal protein S2
MEEKTEKKEKTIKTAPKEADDFGLDINEMVEAGIYFGHRVSMINPKMKPYTQGCRNNVHIINLEFTIEKLTEALTFIKKLVSEGGLIIFVGTKIQLKKIVEETAKECNFPYVNQRWLGGTFTNFEIIKKRIDYFNDFEKAKEEGGWDKYTKKERVKMQRELENLKVKFDGIKNLERLPDAVFVCDMNKDEIVVKEARARGIKVIGLSDTNIDPNIADYPIPANDDAVSSVSYILNKVKEVILKSKPKEEKTKSESKEN